MNFYTTALNVVQTISILLYLTMLKGKIIHYGIKIHIVIVVII